MPVIGDHRGTSPTEWIEIQRLWVNDLPRAARGGRWISALPGLVQPVLLPMLFARGREPGPLLLAVAGVHGDEYEGMEAIRLVHAGLDPERMSGTFVGIPVANPFAYEARGRTAPLSVDGLNLARIFPGDPDGTPSRALAAALLDLVERNVTRDDLFVDLHSGSADVAYATLIGFRDVPGPAHERSEEAARHFGGGLLWRIPDSVGPFNAETARRGIPTVGTETTGRAGLDRTGVAVFASGLRNLLRFLGILSDEPAPYSSQPARTSVDVVSPASGFFRASRGLHDEVEAGEELGTIVDVFGEPLQWIFSPAAGTIWAARAMPAVRSGELIYTIALPPT